MVEVDGSPEVLGALHERSVVYGGGGVFGIAYGTGVAHGLAAEGLDLAAVPSLGTSAGSWVASILALAIPYEEVAALEAPSVPTRHDVLADRARALFGDQRHHLVAASAVCIPSGRRHILDGGRYPLADLAAASSAVPGLFPPHLIEGRRYADGGMWSATSVDAAAEARQVVVVAPLAGPVMGPMGRTAGFMLERELRTWRDRHPGRTIALIRPNHEIGRLAGRNPLNLFDADRARAVYPLAVEQGRRWAERLLGDAPAAA
ncbi:MAG: patatin-like phospholipase family protein [Acidimicrobiales bacterium]